jgi:hypothetical protein
MPPIQTAIWRPQQSALKHLFMSELLPEQNLHNILATKAFPSTFSHGQESRYSIIQTNNAVRQMEIHFLMNTCQTCRRWRHQTLPTVFDWCKSVSWKIQNNKTTMPEFRHLHITRCVIFSPPLAQSLIPRPVTTDLDVMDPYDTFKFQLEIIFRRKLLRTIKGCWNWINYQRVAALGSSL